MEAKARAILVAAAVLLAIGCISAYTTQIHAPAVLANEDSGILTLISLNVTPGNGSVSVIGPAEVGPDTLVSARTAAAYASAYLGINQSTYNFTYDIKDNDSNVSGPSAGLAFTVLAVEALRHEQLYPNFTLTGTIDQNGNVGEVGGVYDKLAAAKASGMKYAIVPYASPSDPEYLTYYLTQQTFNIPILQVSNASEALPYVGQSGLHTVKPLQFNSTKDYHLGELPEASVGCSGCNESYFGQLANYTFNLTQQWAYAISGNLTQASRTMSANLATYESISSRGYMYAGADLAFLQFPETFVLAESGNLSMASAQYTFGNVSSYCSSLTPPQLTSTNYEYVIGGELRQQLASANLAQAQQYLNTSNTTDDIIYSLYSLAPSYAWCASSAEMYGIASEMGGSPVALSQAAKAEALAAIDSAKSALPDPIYLSAAMQAYNQSEYGAAIYAATYSQTFGMQTPSNLTVPQLASLINANAANSTFGIWPSQFANSALFSLYEANATGGGELANVTGAYTESELAANLAKANRMITGYFVPAIPESAAGSGVTAILDNQTVQIGSIESQLSEIYATLFALTLVMAVVAVLLLALLLRGRQPAGGKPAVPAKKR